MTTSFFAVALMDDFDIPQFFISNTLIYRPWRPTFWFFGRPGGFFHFIPRAFRTSSSSSSSISSKSEEWTIHLLAFTSSFFPPIFQATERQLHLHTTTVLQCSFSSSRRNLTESPTYMTISLSDRLLHCIIRCC